MKNIIQELNRRNKEYLIMTKDRKCILRGTAATGYLLTTVEEKNRKQLRICCSTQDISIDSTTKCSDKVKELYNLESNKIGYKLRNELEFVTIYKEYKTTK